MSRPAWRDAAGGSLVLAAVALAPHHDPVGVDDVVALVDAAAGAGFGGLSVWTAHHDWAVAGGLTSDEVRDLHRDRGLATPVSEVLTEWIHPGGRRLGDGDRRVLDVSARLGARDVVAVALGPSIPPLRETAARLAALCDEAADRGLRISIEFLPWTGIPDLASAARLLEAADRENLGLVLDAWHWQRQPGGPDAESLRRVPPERIHVLQLNDAPQRDPGDLLDETWSGRLLPGEGEIDLVALLDELEAMGAAPVVVSEVFSDRLRDLGPTESAARQFAAAAAVLGAGATPAA